MSTHGLPITKGTSWALGQCAGGTRKQKFVSKTTSSQPEVQECWFWVLVPRNFYFSLLHKGEERRGRGTGNGPLSDCRSEVSQCDSASSRGLRSRAPMWVHVEKPQKPESQGRPWRGSSFSCPGNGAPASCICPMAGSVSGRRRSARGPEARGLMWPLRAVQEHLGSESQRPCKNMKTVRQPRNAPLPGGDVGRGP